MFLKHLSHSRDLLLRRSSKLGKDNACLLGMCRIPLYRIPDIPDSSKFKHNSQIMKWEYRTIVSVVYN